ncbi:MAG: MgtC/SapB family protein [Candidatus Woesearchaeota archaeon]|nr:MAG: MgtC/SapB family protein [Candidatus Woesearchaeota archaeon]
MEFMVVLSKLLLVFVLSGLFGLNRQWAHKPIGFGTFIFVSLGASALAIASLELSGSNPLPLLSAIVTGIGFLGAGAMIKTTDKIFGVTTAASIWLFAIFGLLVGVGQYATGFIIYAFVWVVVGVDLFFEYRGVGSYQRKAVITTTISLPEKKIRAILSQSYQRYKLLEFTIDKKEESITRLYLVEGPQDSIMRLPYFLKKEPGFIKCVVQ